MKDENSNPYPEWVNLKDAIDDFGWDIYEKALKEKRIEAVATSNHAIIVANCMKQIAEFEMM